MAKTKAPIVRCGQCNAVVASLAALLRHRVLKHGLGKR